MTPTAQRIPATSDVWLYTFVLQPHIEGVERLNRVWSGVDHRTFVPTNLSLGDRLIYLISGLLLVIPLLATVVWICMQTFGNPEHLSDPHHVAAEQPAIPSGIEES